ncbi:MAG TPA: hypothetical protein VF131_01050 [Blastocatellia bacterium]|nr:hypothetical protein [Blastocatellia bacterium]
MNRVNRIILLSLFCLTGFVSGCINNGPANVNESDTSTANANANGPVETAASPSSDVTVRQMPGSPAPPPETPDQNGPKPPPTLLGTYSIIEVHHKGLIDMISAENTTEINFTPDGRFSRLSRKGGKVDHTDSGDFRIEGQDQLVLLIRESKQQIQDPPVVRRHKIEVSADGTELRMMSKQGLTAMFRKTTPLPGR